MASTPPLPRFGGWTKGQLFITTCMTVTSFWYGIVVGRETARRSMHHKMDEISLALKEERQLNMYLEDKLADLDQLAWLLLRKSRPWSWQHTPAMLVGDRFEVDVSSASPLVIGRTSKKEINTEGHFMRLGSEEKTISRQHVKIEQVGHDTFQLVVLGKKGVTVNGTRKFVELEDLHPPVNTQFQRVILGPIPLSHRTQLLIGSSTFVFLLPEYRKRNTTEEDTHVNLRLTHVPDTAFILDDPMREKVTPGVITRKKAKTTALSETVSIALLPMPVGWSKLEKARGRKGRHVSGLKKYTPVPHDPLGRPIMPIVIGGMRVLSLGTIVTDRRKFHAKRYIWPVGYKSTRIYPSMRDPTRKVSYLSEILDGGTEPWFRVTPEDHEPIEAATPSAAWGEVVKRVAKLKEERFGQKLFTTVSGPEMYGYSHPTIVFLIQRMPGARLCERYVFQEFIAKEVAPRGTAAEVKVEADEGSEEAFEDEVMEEDVMEGGSVF